MIMEILRKVGLWIVATLGAIGLLIGVYFLGSSRRKGDLAIRLAEQELEKANKAYAATEKQSATIREKQVRLVSDILIEQERRENAVQQAKGLSDDDIDTDLHNRGILRDK